MSVSYIAATPRGGVELRQGSSLLRSYFDRVIPYILGYNVDDLLYFFRLRHGDPAPPGTDRINHARRFFSRRAKPLILIIIIIILPPGQTSDPPLSSA